MVCVLGSRPGWNPAPPGVEIKKSMAKKTKSDRGVLGFFAADVVRSCVRVQPEELKRQRLIVPRDLFEFTLERLAERSGGWRESAAIWAGRLCGDDAEASDVFFHHELCDDRAGPLSLELSEQAKFELYKNLAIQKKTLVALIHTHPEDWVELSPVDERNQICSRIGFWSLVVPWYGRSSWELETFGVHARADVGWYQYTKTQIPQTYYGTAK